MQKPSSKQNNVFLISTTSDLGCDYICKKIRRNYCWSHCAGIIFDESLKKKKRRENIVKKYEYLNIIVL